MAEGKELGRQDVERAQIDSFSVVHGSFSDSFSNSFCDSFSDSFSDTFSVDSFSDGSFQPGSPFRLSPNSLRIGSA